MPNKIARNQRRLLMAAALIAIIALVSLPVWQRWRATRRSVYIVGVPEQGAALFLGSSTAPPAIPLTDRAAALHPIYPKHVPVHLPWDG